MKRIALLSLFTFSILAANAQIDTSLNENFDVKCAIPATTYPGGGWYIYNPLPATIPQGEWECTSTLGRPETSGTPTPGVMCTSIYGSPLAYNLDTSLLITPALLFSTTEYPGNIYLNFDTKTTPIFLPGTLTVLESQDSSFHTFNDSVTSDVIPGFSYMDSTGWVTHQVNITAYKGIGIFYLAFRYTSTTTDGSIWYLDNVNTTSSPLLITDLNKEKLPLTIIGTPTTSEIKLSYTTAAACMCNLSVYDMIGRQVHKEQFSAKGGAGTYTISGLNLVAGMYLVKLDDGSNYGVTKAVVQ